MSQANVWCHVFITVIYLSHRTCSSELSLQKKDHTPNDCQPPTFCVTLINSTFRDSWNKGRVIHYSPRGSLATNFAWYLFSNQDPANRHTCSFPRSAASVLPVNHPALKGLNKSAFQVHKVAPRVCFFIPSRWRQQFLVVFFHFSCEFKTNRTWYWASFQLEEQFRVFLIARDKLWDNKWHGSPTLTQSINSQDLQTVLPETSAVTT